MKHGAMWCLWLACSASMDLVWAAAAPPSSVMRRTQPRSTTLYKIRCARILGALFVVCAVS